MTEQQLYRLEAKAVIEAQKVSEKQRAIELDKMPPMERLKMQADQQKRMQAAERNQENYLQKVVPKQEAKIKKNDELVNMYIEKKQMKED